MTPARASTACRVVADRRRPPSAWLAGWRAQGMAGHDHAGVHASAMQLRANAFDMDLGRGSDAVVDAATCDCCQTDVAMTDRGPLLVYRDRGEDGSATSPACASEGGRWTSPTAVHADGWQVSACPVNGPAVAARQRRGGRVVQRGRAAYPYSVRLARSTDAGDHHAAPVVVTRAPRSPARSTSPPTATSMVVWLREDATGQTLMLARYAPDLSKPLQRIEVAQPGGPRPCHRQPAAGRRWRQRVAGVDRRRRRRGAPAGRATAALSAPTSPFAS